LAATAPAYYDHLDRAARGDIDQCSGDVTPAYPQFDLGYAKVASARFGRLQRLCCQCFQDVAGASLGSRHLLCFLKCQAIRNRHNQQIAR
jgi:hypothetical protein